MSLCLSALVSFCGCSVAKATGKTVRFIGKATWNTAEAGGKVAWGTGKVAGKGVRTTINIINGKTVVPLRRQANSLFVTVRLNRKVTTELLLDTGASRTQISAGLAARLGIDVSKGEDAALKIADGRMVSGKQVYIRDLRIGRARVNNVPAVVFSSEQDKGYDGLLGMTFLKHFIFQIDSDKEELILKKRVE